MRVVVVRRLRTLAVRLGLDNVVVVPLVTISGVVIVLIS